MLLNENLVYGSIFSLNVRDFEMNVQRLRGHRKQRMGGFCLHKAKKTPRKSWFLNEAARFDVGDCAKCIACGLVKMKMKTQHRRDPFLMPHLSTFLLSFSRHRKYKNSRHRQQYWFFVLLRVQPAARQTRFFRAPRHVSSRCFIWIKKCFTVSILLIWNRLNLCGSQIEFVLHLIYEPNFPI